MYGNSDNIMMVQYLITSFYHLESIVSRKYLKIKEVLMGKEGYGITDDNEKGKVCSGY